ncbi:hypothetical protein, partial [Mailhella sp.]|uniref:hypothetical protein n=2 Tax=Mailhella sp. TaxID=1981029 RepID=UPI0040648DE6
MLTKGAIGNLVNRYRAVLTKCNLINTFGSLAVASMLVLGGAGVAGATITEVGGIYYHDGLTISGVSSQQNWSIAKGDTVWVNDSLKSGSAGYGVWVAKFNFTGEENSTLKIEAAEGKTITYGLAHSGEVDVTNLIIKTDSSAICSYGNMNVMADDIDITSGGNGIFVSAGGTGSTTVGGDDLTINAVNGIRNHGDVGCDLTVTSKDIEITASNHGIYSSSAANTTISSDGGDIVINATKNGINVDRANKVDNIGKVAVSGGNVTIESESGHAVTAEIQRIMNNDMTPVVSIAATENVTITAKDSSKNAVYARLKNGYSGTSQLSVSIEAGGALDINGAVKLMDVKEHSVLKGKTVSIEAANQALNVQNGWVDVVAEESIDIKSTGSYGIFAQYGAGDGIALDAEKVSVEGASGAIHASVSNTNGAPKVDINANQIDIDGDIYAVDKSSVTLGGTGQYADGYTANVAGDITAGADSTINLDLGEAGSLTGAVNAADMEAGSTTGVHLDLGEGSTWTATGDSNVTSLAGDDMTVNIAAGAQIEAASFSGNGGNINMVDADELGSFTASNVESENPEFKVQAIDEAGNVKNADGVSAATLAAMAENVKVDNAAVTATAADGIVNAGYTITMEEGKPVVTGGGVTSVTEAVLESASINTVALTHILTNDVRKRLGDIRADQNKTGVWMRWDGG